MDTNNKVESQLREIYNPDGSTLRKAQLRMLDMLIYIDKICRDNNITYMLGYGTLLGAIRHNGFIPWDDDVDLIVPRKDYDRLVSILLTNQHPHYKLQCAATEPKRFYPWAVLRDTKSRYVHQDKHFIQRENLLKYRGLQIDLFPISNHVFLNLNKDFLGRDFGYNVMKFIGYSRFQFMLANIVNGVHKALCALFRIVTPRRKYWTTDYGIWAYDSHKHETMFPVSEVKFEGHLFYAPHDPDAYLRNNYGDYMALPDEKEMNHHMISNIILEE